MRRISRTGVHKLSLQLHKYMSQKQKVGVIGLGQMGAHMAGNLCSQFEVIGVDPDIVGTQSRLQSQGYSQVSVVDSISSLPKCNQYVLSLPNNSVVKQVVEQLSSHIQKDSVIVDTSTISPQLARQNSQLLKDTSNSLYIDAPVSGGVVGSQKATLTFMLGLPSDHHNTHSQQSALLLPLLSAMGTKNVFCGGPGKGQSIKLVNNLALAIQMLSICETFAAGQLLDIDPVLQMEVFTTSTSRCWSVDTYVPVQGLLENVPANKGYEGGFSVDLLLKDLGLVIDEIKMSLKDQQVFQEQFSVTQVVFDRYQRLSKEYGLGNKDFGVMFKSIADRMQ